jgi:hypothetical protein
MKGACWGMRNGKTICICNVFEQARIQRVSIGCGSLERRVPVGGNRPRPVTDAHQVAPAKRTLGEKPGCPDDRQASLG